ncbi:MAG: hypothetical protein AAF787_14815 [Chloroflexota bacterium]
MTIAHRDIPFEAEYEPTAGVPEAPTLPLLPLLRPVIRMVVVLMALLLAVMGVATRSTASLLLAYEGITPENTHEIMLYDTRTGVQAPLLHGDLIREARWLPNGTGLLLLEARAWAVHQLDGIARDPTSTERIGMRAQPSPDWARAVSMETGRLVVFNGRSSRVLLSDSPLHALNVTWSPDSRHLAVTAQSPAGGLREVLLLDADTGEWRVLSSEPAFYTSLRWSPEGTRLAFIDPRYDIQLVDIATGDLTRLPYPHIETIDAMTWTPDGTQLTYATRSGLLYLLDVETGRSTRIYDGLESDTELAWSPDGRWLAISTGTLIEHRLYVRDAHSGQMTLLDDRVRASGLLAWQP